LRANFSLSADPELQRLQLDDLMKESQQALERLTSPIIIFTAEELEPHNKRVIEGKSNWSYNPPPTRFAKISYY
jgi:hypothetical protein